MKAVFLDRDGVLNDVVMRDGRPGSPRSVAELRFHPGAATAVAEFRRAGYLTLVVSNQPDLTRTLLSSEAHDQITTRLWREVEPDDIAVCPHDDNDHCACRKPRPGLLEDLARRWGVTLGSSYMIGDSWRDVDAGRAAGCKTVLIRTDYNQSVRADFEVPDLSAATRLILEQPG